MMRNLGLAIAAAAVSLVIGFAGGVVWSGGIEQTAESQALAPRTDLASIMIDFGGGEVSVFPDLAVGPEVSLLELLEGVTTENGVAFETKAFEGLGTMVQRIGDKENGDDGRYWIYWVNNAKLPIGADQYQIQPGDIVHWKFEGFTDE